MASGGQGSKGTAPLVNNEASSPKKKSKKKSSSARYDWKIGSITPLLLAAFTGKGKIDTMMSIGQCLLLSMLFSCVLTYFV